jgi:Transposase DDE domain
MFNHLNDIVAIRLMLGNVSDASPVISPVKGRTGKLFGDKGYIGKKLGDTLLRKGRALMTRVREKHEVVPMTLTDKMLLNATSTAEATIGHVKAFSSLNLASTARPSMPSSTSSPHSPPVSSTPSRPESPENHRLITYSWGYANHIAWALNRAITRHRSSPDHAARSTRFDNYSPHSRPKVRQENWPKFATEAQTVFCEVE